MENNYTYEVITQEDPETGELILPIPQELLDRMGWKEGDKLKWAKNDDDSWYIVKDE